MKTIAQQLNVKKFPFEIKDEKGNRIYHELSTGFWHKLEYDSEGNKIYSESSLGYWSKREFDSEGNEIYYENSNGIIVDKRPKPELILDKQYITDGIHITKTKDGYLIFTIQTQHFNVSDLDELTNERFEIEIQKQKDYIKKSLEMINI